MKILVTGASGFIGREVTDRLCKRGYEVHAVARKSIEIPDAIWHEVNLLDKSKVEQLFSEVRPTHLVHFAWVTEPGEFWNSSENNEWESATRLLFDAFAEKGGTRFVGAGSVAEYVWTGEPCLESRLFDTPATLYGQRKLAAWQYVEQRAREVDISSAWGRVFWLYGPHEHPRRLIPYVINGILNKRSVDCSSGEQLRDFLHVYDVADAFVRLLESEVGGAVNIASGEPVAIKTIVSHIATKLAGQDLIRLGAIPTNILEPDVVCGDVSKLKFHVGFTPQVQLQDGLDSTISWWQSLSECGAVSA